MLNVAFLGSDSTHTEAFARRINFEDGPLYGDARVVSIWGEDAGQTQRKAEALRIPRVASTIEDALRDADIAMVIGRFGESHYRPASQALARGVPTFVDKPFTVDVDEARDLMAMAARAGVPLTSSSPLRFAPELLRLKATLETAGHRWRTALATAPANCTDLGPDPRLDSVFFYGIHAVEMLLELVSGCAIDAVDVKQAQTVVTAHLGVSGGRAVVLQLVRDLPEAYFLDLHTAAGSHRAEIALDGGYYDGLLQYIIREFPSATRRIPIESTVRGIEILDALSRTGS